MIVLGRVIVLRLVASLKAYPGIEVTPSGTEIDVKLVQPVNIWLLAVAQLLGYLKLVSPEQL